MNVLHSEMDRHPKREPSRVLRAYKLAVLLNYLLSWHDSKCAKRELPHNVLGSTLNQGKCDTR